MDSQRSTTKLLAIVGQTASGKSGLALDVAKQFNGEIIAADSWTVYKEFDIGTSKPSQADQRAVRHHLIDIRDAPQGFNAPLFKDLANAAIKDIHNRGKLPILVGGTGLYMDSVLYDYGFLESVSGDDRGELNRMELADLLSLAKKRAIDLEDIDIRNKRRVIRAIESGGQKPSKSGLRQGTVIVGLQLEAGELKSRIKQRVTEMLNQGLEAEVQKLAAKYGWQTEPMKGIGYAEWQEYFEEREELEQVRLRIIAATGRLAKRQWTWSKRNPDIHWFGSKNSAFDYISKVLST